MQFSDTQKHICYNGKHDSKKDNKKNILRYMIIEFSHGDNSVWNWFSLAIVDRKAIANVQSIVWSRESERKNRTRKKSSTKLFDAVINKALRRT